MQENILKYCQLAKRKGYKEQDEKAQLPTQPMMKQISDLNYQVPARDLVYVNSFQKLVDIVLDKPKSPEK